MQGQLLRNGGFSLALCVPSSLATTRRWRTVCHWMRHPCWLWQLVFFSATSPTGGRKTTMDISYSCVRCTISDCILGPMASSCWTYGLVMLSHFTFALDSFAWTAKGTQLRKRLHRLRCVSATRGMASGQGSVAAPCQVLVCLDTTSGQSRLTFFLGTAMVSLGSSFSDMFVYFFWQWCVG